MASSGKRKTTMAKLSRESRLRERRMEKQARKNARKQAAADPTSPSSGDDLTGYDQIGDDPAGHVDESVAPGAEQSAPEPVARTLTDG
jgi:hypothetical protein